MKIFSLSDDEFYALKIFCDTRKKSIYVEAYKYLIMKFVSDHMATLYTSIRNM